MHTGEKVSGPWMTLVVMSIRILGIRNKGLKSRAAHCHSSDSIKGPCTYTGYIYIYLYVWKQSAIKRVNRVAAVDTYLGKPAGRRTGVEFLEFLGITKCSSNQLHFSKWMASAADAETLSQSWSRSASPVVDPCNSFH